MSGLLNNEPAASPVRRHGADVWHVHGKPFTHSAAKFWSSLFDEIAEDFPTCDQIVMESCDGERYRAKHLYPELDLAGAAASVAGQSFADCLRSIAIEMEVCGYPTPVRINLYSGDDELLSRNLPLDCVDADLFPHLVVWLLEWSGAPEPAWNNDALFGSISARDRRRQKAYAFEFELQSAHLHEGLIARSLTILLRNEPYSMETA